MKTFVILEYKTSEGQATSPEAWLDMTDATAAHPDLPEDEFTLVVEYRAYALEISQERLRVANAIKERDYFKNGYENVSKENQKLRSVDRIDPEIYKDRCDTIERLRSALSKIVEYAQDSDLRREIARAALET